ncbi:MAG: hypothetical protein U5S82_19480 [Gammaproteobacteria bacterium]|nr:hypothetical protein [Gammaproteobacteria bacterium]
MFIILLTETDVVAAERALERLRERLTELLEVNLGRDPNIKAQMLAVAEDLDLDDAVERFLKTQLFLDDVRSFLEDLTWLEALYYFWPFFLIDFFRYMLLELVLVPAFLVASAQPPRARPAPGGAGPAFR